MGGSSKGSGQGPTPPDPWETAKAQSRINIGSAGITQRMNMMDQYGPDGSLTYESDGFDYVPDGFGGQHQVTKYKAVQRLSDQQQKIYDTNAANTLLANQLANQGGQFAKVLMGENAHHLSTAADYSDAAIARKTAQMINPRLDDRFQRDQAALEASLINRGIRAGSEAYSDQMGEFQRGRNDAYTQEALANRQQAINEIGMPRQALISQIQSLLGMRSTGANSQNYVNTPNINVAAPDYGGMAYKTFDGQMRNYELQLQQAKDRQSQKNSAMGGLFGLGGSMLQAIPTIMRLSDRRAKTDIEEVGELHNGLKVYRYRYKAGGPPHIGVMAQDVEKVKPDAVKKAGGLKMVDYIAATED